MANYRVIFHDGMGGDSLKHFGILGQKWGTRRFQYEDGSLTPEGRKRYGVGEARERRSAIQREMDDLDSEFSDLYEKKKAIQKKIDSQSYFENGMNGLYDQISEITRQQDKIISKKSMLRMELRKLEEDDD